jgi:RNA polymerase sigma-70 factor, ECF subfamily
MTSVMDDRDPEAFRALYRAHYGTVCRYLAARAHRSAVEDVAAETFLVAWRRQAELPPHIVPWLLNTAAKCLANARRSRLRCARRRTSSPAPPPRSTTPTRSCT